MEREYDKYKIYIFKQNFDSGIKVSTRKELQVILFSILKEWKDQMMAIA